ncbi:hypothetical protein lwe2325 [Listeria welshimeri serovar 6b str. SLCC5334]|uniref:Uncharacterized protein n=1 Tax=Listeria welshimeri serovar 6b (strain ATCC 35897 / DSM 20650 / CCUG 15529 / CIP 8149 / NCTC 11857 / SLCC 5334 / V8) TaxID=386043 RepID=A0AL61_LISW6|nr:hypothetical protein lwe2325 [Listeria welshimeri serovar 6b str. SLCC5334]
MVKKIVIWVSAVILVLYLVAVVVNLLIIWLR